MSADKQSNNPGQKLYTKAKQVIPGGTQLLSKRPEMFSPAAWPCYYDQARGCRVTDLAGNELIDMAYMGIGACVLGYADPDVNTAVKQAIDKGSMTTLNCPEEVQLAEALIDLHPWSEAVRFTRSGGEAVTVAVRIARAASGKDKVLFCGYHGWHDWYLASNIGDTEALDGHLLPGLAPAGVPRALAQTAIPFAYNDIQAFDQAMSQHDGQIGAVIMEPMRSVNPDPGFLQHIRKRTEDKGIALIFDEITSGFRIAPGGAHLTLDVQPDIAVFAKALGNGFPIAAVVGKQSVMEAAQRSFISSTSWTERTGFAAAIATINKFVSQRVWEHLAEIGKAVRQTWLDAAATSGLNLEVGGLAPLSTFSLQIEDANVAKTFFTEQMLNHGFLATKALYASFAHEPESIHRYGDAVEHVFSEIITHIQRGDLREQLAGDPAHTGFHRLT